MDKNMINIDDLLKERLTGGEEKERPGAWLQMRDLLDKEMPVTKAPIAAVNWRRMFGYMAALLLLSAVSIGGYQMAVTERAEKAAYDEVAANIPAKTNAIPHSNTTNNNSTNGNNELGDTSNPFRTKKKQDGTSTVSLDKGDKQEVSENINAVTAKDTKHTNKAEALKTTTTTTTNNNKLSENNNTAKKEKGHKLLDDNRKNALIASAALENSKPAPVIDKKITGKADEKLETPRERQYASGKSLGNKDLKLKEDKKIPATTGNTEKGQSNSKTEEIAANTVSAGKEGVAKNKKPGAATQADYLVGKQMVSKIEIRETYDRKLGKKIDTISTGRTEMEILIPAEKTAAVSSTPAAPNMTAALDVPTANNTIAKINIPAKRKRPLITVTEEDNTTDQIVPSSSIVLSAGNVANTENLVPLSNFKVSTKQNSNYARTNMIEQMIQNAKVNIGSAKFYGGIVGGVNTSLSGNNSMSGFQLGVSGTLSLNERWGIVSELKYMHRFNSSPFKNDGYANLDNATVNGVTTYTWDSVNRSLKFPTVSAMELPIYIRYSLNRLNFHAGMNLIYNFTVSNIDVDSIGIRKVNNEGPVMQGAVNYSFADGVPRVSVDDFSSRFSLGYLFGIGYQFTPAIQLDVRMTKSLWDNAKTPGAKEISKKLYDVPSVQINLSYRFSNNKFRPYHSR